MFVHHLSIFNMHQGLSYVFDSHTLNRCNNVNMFSTVSDVLSVLQQGVFVCVTASMCVLTSCPGVWPHHSVWSPRGERGAWPASWRPQSRLGSHWPECRCCRAPNAPDCPNHTPLSQTARLWGWHRCQGEDIRTCTHKYKHRHTSRCPG